MKEYMIMKLNDDFENITNRIKSAILSQCVKPQCSKFKVDLKMFQDWIDEKGFWDKVNLAIDEIK